VFSPSLAYVSLKCNALAVIYLIFTAEYFCSGADLADSAQGSDYAIYKLFVVSGYVLHELCAVTAPENLVVLRNVMYSNAAR